MPAFRSDKKKGLPLSPILERIRQELDPAFSYVIFEKEGTAEKNTWIELYASLGGLNLPVLELKTYEDVARKKVLLVARLEAERTEAIMEEMIGARLPRDIIFYVYGSFCAG